MQNLTLKQKIIGMVITLGLVLLAIFANGLSSTNPNPIPKSAPAQNQIDKVVVVSTSPQPLNGATVLPTQKISITFNEPMVNDPARITLAPETKFNAQLSTDHKTITIEPLDPYKLGQGYSLTIKSGYGTDTGKKLDEDLKFEYKTIDYSGI